MKYINANEILPEELLKKIQNYYQGGYLYIPKKAYSKATRQTDYKIELEKRNQHIYLKHLEGRTNKQLGSIYHLSEPSIRRIISKEKEKYHKMKNKIEQSLSLWEIENKQLEQIYPSAWEINHSYVIKIYDDKRQLERNIKIATILSRCNVPVAEILPTKTGEEYAVCQNTYFLMTKKLQGNNISDIKDTAMARNMGCAIAKLHQAFIQCEKEIEFWDNSLLDEITGWIQENLAGNEWQIISKEEYSRAAGMLGEVYGSLPKQLIHRDVHFGNFLFFEGSLSGYVDFDLSQRNIRIFDICYFLAGLLAEETDEAFTKNEWIQIVAAVVAGYENLTPLIIEEKAALPCVMECIEILFIAYFIGVKDMKQAISAYNVFQFIQNCEGDIKELFKNAIN